MPRRKRRSNGWTRSNGKWSRTFGEERGRRVRLFQKKKDGSFYRDIWLPGVVRDRKCVGTSDRSEAERIGRQFQAGLLNGEAQTHSGVVTLRRLWERYSTECGAFLDNKAATRNTARTRAAILLAFFGEECDVRDLTPADQDAYVTKRVAGGIRYTVDGKTDTTGKVRLRSVECDVKLLHGMLLWATTVRVGRKGRLLDRHPLTGVKLPKQASPRREVATPDRFDATRKALSELAAKEPHRAEMYMKVDLALVLAEATGRRLSAIGALRFEDIDFAANEIVWPAATDKQRKRWSAPMRDGLADEIRSYQMKLESPFGYVLPKSGDPEKPMTRHALAAGLKKAETHAGLPKLDGALWHAYRRNWATQRKHLPLVDVAAAGGWSDTTTLLQCYQHADPETMRAVVNEPRKVRSQVRIGLNGA